MGSKTGAEDHKNPKLQHVATTLANTGTHGFVKRPLPGQAPRFHTSVKGRAVGLSSDGCMASRVRNMGGSCLLFGSAALPWDVDGIVKFSVLITMVGAAFPGGVLIGLTTTPPEVLAVVPERADEVPNCWLVGGDGATWDGKAWCPCNFVPSTLQVGDVVRVSASEQNGLQVSVCGQPKASVKMIVQPGTPLFILVDLLGCTLGVKLLQNDGRELVKQPG